MFAIYHLSQIIVIDTIYIDSLQPLVCYRLNLLVRSWFILPNNSLCMLGGVVITPWRVWLNP